MEAIRLGTKLIAGWQDNVVIKVTGKTVKSSNTVEPLPMEVRVDQSPNESSPSSSPPPDGGTKEKKGMLARGKSVNMLKKASIRSVVAETNQTQIEIWCLVFLIELAAVVYCSYVVFVVEVSVVMLDFSECITGFLINWWMQASAQMIATYIYLVIKSRQTKFGLHLVVDDALLPQSKYLMFVILCLGPWIANTLNGVVANNLMRAFPQGV